MTTTKKPRLPTLRAVGPDDEPEGFTVAQVDVTDLDTWHVETDGMRASDIGDTMTSESLARLFAAAPDLLAACESVALRHGDDGPCWCVIPIHAGTAHHMSCQRMRAAITKARGEP